MTNIYSGFKDVSDNPMNRLSDSPLGRQIENFNESPIKNYDSSLSKAAVNELSSEVKDKNELRNLSEEEKKDIKDKLGWSDKQIAKCTIDDNGVIHYKTDREDMEGQATENGIRYERKTIDIHGVKVDGVFPVFDSAFDVNLPEEMESSSNSKQFGECNRQLKEAVNKNPELAKQFTKDQLEDIENGDTPEGYTWHHNEEVGKMQLVKTSDHDRAQGGAAHTGGKSLWGGGYTCSEVSDNSEIAANNSNTSNKEV